MQDIQKSRLRSEKIATLARHAPNKSGIYIMKDKKGRIIYVGKAVSIKKRLVSHFSRPDIDPRHASLVSETRNVSWQTTPSVIEALVLESRLIKKYNPRYNIKDRDDKSFLYVAITKEEWPRVILTRESDLNRHSDPANGGGRISREPEDDPRKEIQKNFWSFYFRFGNQGGVGYFKKNISLSRLSEISPTSLPAIPFEALRGAVRRFDFKKRLRRKHQEFNFVFRRPQKENFT